MEAAVFSTNNHKEAGRSTRPLEERAMNKPAILLLTLAVGVPSPAASQVPVEKIAYYTCAYIHLKPGPQLLQHGRER